MGNIFSGYKSALINDIANGSTKYYAFAAAPWDNPNPIGNGTNPVSLSYDVNLLPILTPDYFSSQATNWQMLFGKRVQSSDIMPVVKSIMWKQNTVYEKYDNTKVLAGNYYVVTQVDIPASGYHVFKCIDNNNGGPSTIAPAIGEDLTTFQYDGDGYKWRFITSITTTDYNKFATPGFIPMYPNNEVRDLAFENSCVDVIQVVDSGTGYHSYHSGIIRGIDQDNPRLLQIEESASSVNEFYTGNAIYFHNESAHSNQIKDIVEYSARTDGSRWVLVDSDLDLTGIDTGSTQYIISPKVVIKTDGLKQPIAYTVMNTVANNIGSIKVIEPGSYISWADVSIQSNSTFGSGANVYPIVPPPGGHGVNPAEEFGIKGYCIATEFANTDGLPNNVLYTRIGLIADPYEIDPGTGSKTAIPYTGNIFSALTEIEPKNNQVYTVGEVIKGARSLATFPIVANTTGIVAATDFIKIQSAESYFQRNDRVYYSVASGNTKIAGLNANSYYYIQSSNSTGITLSEHYNSLVTADITDTRTTAIAETGHLISRDAVYSYGTVVFSNTSLLLLTGDKTFVDNNYIVSANGQTSSQITLNTLGDIYTRDIRPLYIQDLQTNVQRSNTQSEFYKLVIQI